MHVPDSGLSVKFPLYEPILHLVTQQGVDLADVMGESTEGGADGQRMDVIEHCERAAMCQKK